MNFDNVLSITYVKEMTNIAISIMFQIKGGMKKKGGGLQSQNCFESG